MFLGFYREAGRFIFWLGTFINYVTSLFCGKSMLLEVAWRHLSTTPKKLIFQKSMWQAPRTNPTWLRIHSFSRKAPPDYHGSAFDPNSGRTVIKSSLSNKTQNVTRIYAWNFRAQVAVAKWNRALLRSISAVVNKTIKISKRFSLYDTNVLSSSYFRKMYENY